MSTKSPHVACGHDSLLTADSWLSPQERSAYREFVCLDDDETDNTIRRATNSGRPFGSESFIDMLEFQLNQALKPGKLGRPRKKTGECP